MFQTTNQETSAIHPESSAPAPGPSAPTWHIGDFVSKVSGDFPRTPGKSMKHPWNGHGVEIRSQPCFLMLWMLFSWFSVFPIPRDGSKSLKWSKFSIHTWSQINQDARKIRKKVPHDDPYPTHKDLHKGQQTVVICNPCSSFCAGTRYNWYWLILININ